MTAATTEAPLTPAELRTLSLVSGLPLQSFRGDHLSSALERTFARERVGSVEALVARLRTDAPARTRFRRSVAISTSGLFRDPAQFNVLEPLLPPLLAGHKRRLRVWSAGCANGSELATVALLLDRLGSLDRSYLLGSDLLEENIALARSGSAFPPELASRLRWERRDILAEGAPRGRWNVVLCRNLAIYLDAAAKGSLHETLAAALAPRGILLLGRSERIAEPKALGLDPVAPHAYRKRAR